MTPLQSILAGIAGATSLVALGLIALWGPPLLPLVAHVLGALTLVRLVRPLPLALDGLVALALGAAIVSAIPDGNAPAWFWLTVVGFWLFCWLFVERLSMAIRTGRVPGQALGMLIPLVFGLVLLILWEAATRGGGVPQVLLPPPSQIGMRLVNSLPMLWADFQQTFLKSVLAGFAIGCLSGFLVAIAIDRSPFLKRGLLPISNFMSALPIVGIAPIMVMWFGFDWQSKAAVVVAMTFFPMLVNTLAGLDAASTIERDLMRTYAANYWQTLAKLRLPAAAPFIFNALKINSTLALIGAIVAEFFGTPIVGMGFRISTEVGKLNIDLVWAEIAVAAIAGSAFYGVIALIERGVTFWHPSVRGGRA